jgi:hypothetical protein
MTMKVIPPPERETLEREIHDIVDGDMSEIARLLQIDQSAISRAFNPYNNDRHNPIYQFILYLWAFDTLRMGLADEILNIVCREREKWLPTRKIAACPSRLTGNVGKQFMEAMEREMAGASHDELIKEWGDVERSAHEKVRSVIDQRNERYFGGTAN